MAISIIIGGQYGSEGKGKVAYYWAKKEKASAVVRVGGSNSGHTVYVDEKKYAFRMLPTACLLDGPVSVLPAGSYIDLNVLLEEIEIAKITRHRLKIDYNAVIIKNEYKMKENAMELCKKVGSTQSGTGVALIERIKRDKNNPVLMAKDVEALHPYLVDTKTFLRQLVDDGKHVVIEGTQGYGLSNYHAKDYPYVTSRDTTAAAFLSETGLSPLDVEQVVMVIRAFPIRVAGNSGPFKNETDWETVSKESGAPTYFEEHTTVTHKVRRVAQFDAEIVREAIISNNPNVIVLNHLDYVDYKNKDNVRLSELQEMFLRNVEKEIGRKIDFCGNGEMNIFKL